MNIIWIETEFIKLDQLLKFAEIVDSGGISKILIQDGFVKVNGDVCVQRGKKIREADEVEVLIPDEDGNIVELHQIKVKVKA